MSNYPPGVTGNEWQIAGSQSERDETRHVVHMCDERFEEDFEGDAEGTVIQWDFSSREFVFECPQCKEEVSVEDDPEDYAPDPDEDYDY